MDGGGWAATGLQRVRRYRALNLTYHTEVSIKLKCNPNKPTGEVKRCIFKVFPLMIFFGLVCHLFDIT